MREGWDLVKLGSLCDIQNGFAFDSKLFNNDGKGLPLIRIRDIKRGYSETFTTEECDNAYIVKDGDYLIGMDGEFNIGQWKSENALLNQRVCKLLPSSKILPRFIYYYIPKALKDIEAKTAYATVKHLSSKQIKEISIPNLPLPEQQRIVDVLDQEFAKIDALKANAEKSLQAAKDLFLQMLAHTFANPSWSWKRIGDVFDTGAGGTPLKTYQEYYENGDIPWLRSGEVCKKYITETEMFITQLGMDNSSAKMFPENTVVVAMYGATAGQVGILHLATTTNQAVCGIFPKEDYVPEFIYYSLLNSKKGLVAQATGNAQPNISQIKIKNTLVPVISRKEQEEVVSNLDDLNDRCNCLFDNYQKTISLCDDLKQSLLRKAFNGEL